MNDPKFPCGTPINRPKPAEHKPERVEVRKGIFSVDGKLQTELPITGPQYKPGPVYREPTGIDSDPILLELP